MSVHECSRCRTMAEFETKDGRLVLVHGIYHALAVQQNPKQTATPKDHAAVRMSDGTEILLEPNWSEKARRSESERAQFEGVDVVAEGVAHVQSPKPPEEIAYVLGPCLSPVHFVRAAREEQSR
jgi:hypothetical protein